MSLFIKLHTYNQDILNFTHIYLNLWATARSILSFSRSCTFITAGHVFKKYTRYCTLPVIFFFHTRAISRLFSLRHWFYGRFSIHFTIWEICEFYEQQFLFLFSFHISFFVVFVFVLFIWSFLVWWIKYSCTHPKSVYSLTCECSCKRMRFQC